MNTTGRLTARDLDEHNAELGRSSLTFYRKFNEVHTLPPMAVVSTAPAPRHGRMLGPLLAVAIGLGLCAALLYGLRAL